MPNRVCWKCSTNSHMTRLAEPAYSRPEMKAEGYSTTAIYVFMTCDNCLAASLALIEYPFRVPSGHTLLDARKQFLVDFERDSFSRDIRWLPMASSGREFDDVPAGIASTASEAYECRSVNANRGAIALARSVIEATAKAKGITRGTIQAKIDALYEQNFIREYVKEAAHEVRHWGNDSAHGDFTDPVSDEETDLVLTLMSEVLVEVFQAPARVEKVRLRREERKEAATAPSDPTL